MIMHRSIFFLLLIASVTLHAQRNCETVQTKKSYEIRKANQKIYLKNPPSRETVYVPILFHLVADNDGNGRMEQARVYEALCQVNNTYEQHGFIFYFDSINIVNDDSVVQENRFSFQRYIDPYYINVFMINELATSGSGGYYNFEFDYLALRKNFDQTDDGYTFEHEIGHYFSLEHTNSGWEDMPYDPGIHGDTVLLETVSSSQPPDFPVPVELMDGSNCLEAGDGICDTPPDYGFMHSCYCCEMIYEVWDANGDLVVPMTNNIMSYADGCTDRQFTDQQVDAMITDYNTLRRFNIRYEIEVDTFTPIAENIQVYSPSGLLDTYDDILIQWEPVENADGYYIEYIDGPKVLELVTTDTEYLLADLEPFSEYIVSILPFNHFGSGCLGRERIVFFTGGNSTSTYTGEINDDIEIFPNPVERNANINLNNVAGYTSASITLYDVGGKKVHSENVKLKEGINQILKNGNGLVSGLYLLEIQVENKKFLKKIYVN